MSTPASPDGSEEVEQREQPVQEQQQPDQDNQPEEEAKQQLVDDPSSPPASPAPSSSSGSSIAIRPDIPEDPEDPIEPSAPSDSDESVKVVKKKKKKKTNKVRSSKSKKAAKSSKSDSDESADVSEDSEDMSDAPEDSDEGEKSGKDEDEEGEEEEDSDDQVEATTSAPASPQPSTSADQESRSGSPTRERPADFVSHFDQMMAKKKEENSRKRRRRGDELINDNDDIIANILNEMKQAADLDVEANRKKEFATNKLKLLPFLINQLRKIDLREAFLDSGVLTEITGWLAPLPDRSLPHLNIRESLLKILVDFNLYDVDRIKSSGIGKAVMYLYKHPRETKENKQRAKQLISAWSRPIFNLDSSFSAISREEREERDKELKRRASRNFNEDSQDDGSEPTPKRTQKDTDQIQPEKSKNPGDKGWIPRARVPAPSMRDYVIRPRSKVDGDIGKASKRPANMLEKLMKSHQERRRANKQQRAVNMKIDKL